MAEGKLQRSSTGKLKRNGNGKLIRNSATNSACCCGTEFCATTCCDDTCDLYYISGVTPPFYFKKDGVCYYAGAAIDGPGSGLDELTAGDVEEFDTCNDCLDVVTGCDSDTPCGSCGNDPCGEVCPTPETITVTISGVTMFSGCCSVDGQGFSVNSGDTVASIKIGSGWSGGTYTLTQIGSNPCVYRATFTGPTIDFYTPASNLTCDGTPAGSLSTYIVQIVLGLDILTVSLDDTAPGYGIPAGLNLFTKTFSLSLCCNAQSGSNEYTTADCADLGGGEFGLSAMAYGGTATVTPCS